MRSARPSRTAQSVCLFRAVEHHRPAALRIVDDPLAARFLPLPLRALAGLWGRSPPRSFIGLATYVLSRHATLDRAILESGCEQVVLLGAGYDSRAWRLRAGLGERMVWEVDHPATARAKTRVAERLPEVPRRVVEIDFETQGLRQRLEEEGFDPALSTFWVWEGVSMYLTRAAVRGTLEVVRELSAPGSALGMDLWFYLDDPGVVATWRRASASMLAAFGEPITFGVQPTDAPAFFAGEGFAVRELIDADALGRLAGARRWAMPECYVAVVAPKDAS